MIRIAFPLLGGGAAWTGGLNYLRNLFRVLDACAAGRVQPVVMVPAGASRGDSPFRDIGGVEASPSCRERCRGGTRARCPGDPAWSRRRARAVAARAQHRCGLRDHAVPRAALPRPGPRLDTRLSAPPAAADVRALAALGSRDPVPAADALRTYRDAEQPVRAAGLRALLSGEPRTHGGGALCGTGARRPRRPHAGGALCAAGRVLLPAEPVLEAQEPSGDHRSAGAAAAAGERGGGAGIGQPRRCTQPRPLWRASRRALQLFSSARTGACSA